MFGIRNWSQAVKRGESIRNSAQLHLTNLGVKRTPAIANTSSIAVFGYNSSRSLAHCVLNDVVGDSAPTHCARIQLQRETPACRTSSVVTCGRQTVHEQCVLCRARTVSLSVFPSVTSWYCVRTAKYTENFHRLIAASFYFCQRRCDRPSHRDSVKKSKHALSCKFEAFGSDFLWFVAKIRCLRRDNTEKGSVTLLRCKMLFVILVGVRLITHNSNCTLKDPPVSETSSNDIIIQRKVSSLAMNWVLTLQ